MAKTEADKVAKPSKAKKANASVKHSMKKEATNHQTKKKPGNAAVAPCVAWRGKILSEEEPPQQIAKVRYTLEGRHTEYMWPSAIFLNACYNHGILVQKNEKNYFQKSDQYSNHLKAGDEIRTMPCLTQTEAQLWCHKHAAYTAAARRFPVEVGRLLGTITLAIKENGKKPPIPVTSKPQVPLPRPPATKYTERVKHITKKQALEEAKAEGRHTGETLTESQAHSRGAEIQKKWAEIQRAEPYDETWDPNLGSLPVGNEDELYVRLHELYKWLKKGLKARILEDLHENSTKELYNGLTRVRINATNILEALIDLSNPTSIGYGVPLLHVYPRVVRNGKMWKIQMGVYMHRLLPEILTCQTLHTVISALDEGSYTVSQPLSMPPSGPPVFASAPYPQVDTSVLERVNDDGSNAEEDVEVIDVDMEGGSRDELLLSPFSTRGLLKMLENKGCDVSNWPHLERKLRGKFELNLLLHQQHAICWMVQMENLKGAYGINSLLWEQRTFPDGGHYYYSPAFGQIRLGAPPPLMRGGLLVDEQGLGKTVEVLGLIMATLPEMKRHTKGKTQGKKSAKNTDDNDESGEDEIDYITHTTLIIVPPALVAQWIHEIEKAVGQNTINVSLLLSATGNLQPCLPPPSDESAWEQNTDQALWERIETSDIILTTYDSLDNKGTCARILQNIQWGRIVLDEMQEIRSSTTQIAKNCEKLQCNKRWMLSGTPLFQGVEDLRGELNFLRLEPFGAALEDGFFDFAVSNPWNIKNPHAIATLQILGLVALRRSKDMTIAETGASILDLKPMRIEYIPVPQSHSERALYCWMEYLVACEVQDKKNDIKKPESVTAEKTDAKSRVLCLRLLRELAVTPMLLNGGLGCPSQLDAINQLITRHNRREQLAQSLEAEDESDESSATLDTPRKKCRSIPVMSCDQALRFLTQHQQSARMERDFVTDVAFGGSRGVTNRDRANESADERYTAAKKEVSDGKRAQAEASKRRATTRWHLALELVTTGYYTNGHSHKFSALWKWRRVICDAIEEEEKKNKGRKHLKSATTPPVLLTRGWRPSGSFLETELFSNHPEFSWAHPHAIFAQNIPKEVTQKELATAMRDAAKLVPVAKKDQENYEARLSKLLEVKDKVTSKKAENDKKIQEFNEKLHYIEKKMDAWKRHDTSLKLPSILKVRERKHAKGFWKAVIQFESDEVVKSVMSAAARTAGAPLKSSRSVPHINAMIEGARENMAQAESEYQVHPSAANKKLLAKAKKGHSDISAGLRILQTNNTGNCANIPTSLESILDEASISTPHVLLMKALWPQRNLAPRRMSALVASANTTIADSALEILKQEEVVVRASRVIERLQKVVDGEVSEEINQLSAFGTLEALAHGEVDKTQCSICLGHLGCGTEDDDGATKSNAKKNGSKNKKSAVAMISCGHFFCLSCLNEYVHGRLSGFSQVNCPNCRKEFNFSRDTIQIDHTMKNDQEQLEKERQAAKQVVRDCGKMLEESKGQLSAEMWKALYLAFDLPTGVRNRGHSSLTAIPRDVLTHLRAATGMDVHLRRGDRPSVGSPKGTGRCSKIDALLRDLPRGERSVIFSSNKDCLMHLRTVLQAEPIGVQSIYTGQSTAELKNAVSTWEKDGDKPSDPPPFPCLLVQAGAAAAGLTLTAASKMFLMEPFLRQEEEHQAYARCHRYSQKHKVSVKVYYTPVSVESRLLEWRKRAKDSSGAKGIDFDEGEFESNFEKDARVVYHDVNEESEDEEGASSASSSSSSSYEDDTEVSDDESSDEDVAQANFLLGLGGKDRTKN